MKKEMHTIGNLIEKAVIFFKNKGIEQARLDAEVLLSHLLNLERIQLYVRFDQPLEEAEVNAYREMVRERAAGRPISYILGEKEFMGHLFSVNESVLIPRPDTEILVEAGIRYLRDLNEPLFLDICTGSGAIGISIVKELADAKGIGTDISKEALEVARSNAKTLGVSERMGFLLGDLFTPIGKRKVHGIFSNPPYILSEELLHLQREVRQEPMLALDGGKDGLDFYRKLLGQADQYLLPEGFLMMEVGMGQAAPVSEIALSFGWTEYEKAISDYGGVERVVVFRKPAKAGDDEICKFGK